MIFLKHRNLNNWDSPFWGQSQLLIILITSAILYATNVVAEEKKENTVVIIGEATVKTKPDVAYINVVINTKSEVIETLITKMKDKIDTLEKKLDVGSLNKDIPKITLRKYGITPSVVKKVIGYRREPESFPPDFFPEGADYIRENTGRGVDIFRKIYVYQYNGTQEFTVVIEDTGNSDKIEQLISYLSGIDQDVDLKQTSQSDFEYGVYVGLVKYGLKEETSERIRDEVVSKAFGKAVAKLNSFAKKLNLTSINLTKVSVYEENIYYGNSLIEAGFIPVTARVKLIFYYPN